MEETGDTWEHPNEPNPDTIGDLLPSRSLADALIAAYFDRVHVYLPLFHRSMFQFRLEATYSRRSESLKGCSDIGWLICLCLVFSFGCQQLHNHDPEQAHKLRMKYLSFAKTYFPPRDDIDYQCTSACAAQCTPSHCRPEKQLVAAYRTGCPNGRLDPESSRLVLTQTNRL